MKYQITNHWTNDNMLCVWMDANFKSRFNMTIYSCEYPVPWPVLTGISISPVDIPVTVYYLDIYINIEVCTNNNFFLKALNMITRS